MRIGQGADGYRTAGRTDAGAALAMIDLHEKLRLMRGRVAFAGDGVRQLQPFGRFVGQGDAEHAAADPQHEVDHFGRDRLGGADQIPLVLAVERIDHDHEPSPSQCGQGRIDSGCGHRVGFRQVSDCGHRRILPQKGPTPGTAQFYAIAEAAGIAAVLILRRVAQSPGMPRPRFCVGVSSNVRRIRTPTPSRGRGTRAEWADGPDWTILSNFGVARRLALI